MIRLIGFALATVILTGCATRMYPDGRRERVLMPQVGVVVKVVNNCAATLQIESVDRVEIDALPWGKSATIPISTRPFSGYNRQISLTAFVYDDNLVYKGLVTRTFSVSTQQGTHDNVWIIDHLSSPPGRRCEVG